MVPDFKSSGGKFVKIDITTLVKECSKSKSFSVIERIGVLSTLKDGRLEHGGLNYNFLKIEKSFS